MIFITCHICNKQIKSYLAVTTPTKHIANVDCKYDHLVSTYVNNKLVGYVANWIDPVSLKEYKIHSSININETNLYTIDRKVHNISYNETEIMKINSYFDLPIVNNSPYLSDLIPRLLNLIVFS
jgi:hypothetical protein